jgi:hypothetical protein
MCDPVVEGGSLTELLERVAAELAMAAHSVDDLHALVEHAARAEPLCESLIRKMQTIDLLQQHLTALSGFMWALSKGVPTAWVVGGEAANEVKLSDMRERLYGMGRDREGGDHQPGDVQVF